MYDCAKADCQSVLKTTKAPQLFRSRCSYSLKKIAINSGYPESKKDTNYANTANLHKLQTIVFQQKHMIYKAHNLWKFAQFAF